MLKKSAILGLVLLLAGGGVLGWVLNERKKEQQRAASHKLKYGAEPDEYIRRYNEWRKLPAEERAAMPLELNGYGRAKTKAQLRQEQQERLEADLDKLAAGEMDAYPFADVLYGENWQEAVEDYKKQKEQNEFILTGSLVCTSIGGTATGLCTLVWIGQFLFGGISRLRKPSEANTADPRQEEPEYQEQPSGVALLQHHARVNLSRPREYVPIQTDTDPPGPKIDSIRASQPAASQATVSVTTEPAGQRPLDSDNTNGQSAPSVKATRKIPVLSSGRKTLSHQESSAGQETADNTDATQGSGPGKKAPSGNRADTTDVEETLTAQTSSLEKQIAEIKQMAQSVHQSTVEHSKPLNNTLQELAQQVSAIRDYASHQQERVEKLQEGYDWNIIRTFCLRVIRCIDNVENRIDRLSDKDTETEHLTEVRDELIFALESSGVEQFKPELNSNYRGQEKFAEAVKDKDHCKNSKKAGTIAKVIRPGYQYYIKEDDVKVVRTAQVKLFG